MDDTTQTSLPGARTLGQETPEVSTPPVFTREPFDRDKVIDQLTVGLDLDDIRRQVDNGEQVFIDSETCGLHSIMVLWQFAIDDGPIYLYHIWKEPVWKTVALFEMLMELDYVGFNLSFDHFHLPKIYTIWRLLPQDWIPEEHIEEIALNYEREGQDGPCIKPKRACDLMLHSRKGKFQTAMSRKDVLIRRVPTVLAYALARELEGRIELPEICFAKSKDPNGPRWKVFDRKDKDGNLDDTFKDVVLKFNPAGGLKYLAEHALGWKPKYHFADVEVPRNQGPPDKRLGFIPTALGMAPGGPDDDWKIYNKKREVKGHAWPYWVKIHIDHWFSNEKAREYAYDDIVYTRALCHYFGDPEPGDNDSELACMVGIVRWHGFTIDKPGIKSLYREALEKLNSSPININKPTDVRAYITEAMDEVEAMLLEHSTNKGILTDIAKQCFTEDEHNIECTKCGGDGCLRCGNLGRIDASTKANYDKTGGIRVGNHPAAVRARELLDIKAAAKEVELYQKLMYAGKFHPDFSVIGTLSTRMSGGESGLNSQGIKHDKSVRCMFPLKWDGMVLSGGDFDSFEVVLAAAVYDDQDLFDALTKKVECEGCKHNKVCEKCGGVGKVGKFDCMYCLHDDDGKTTGKRECKLCEGRGWFRKKIHALFGMALFPGATYEQVVESDGTTNDMYTKGKSGVFAMIYGGDWSTLRRNLGIDEDTAKAAEARFFDMFPGIPVARQRVTDMFQSMRQINGRQIIWHDSQEYIESFLGFRRSFILENQVCKALYDLAHNTPAAWKGNNLKIKVVRSMHKGVQTAGGAVSSALFGAAFGLQGANVRAAANHEVQSPGGQICKHVQRRVWDLQPCGVHDLIVGCINVHDEILSVTHPSMVESVAEVVKTTVESYRPQVPLIGMTWNKEMENWAEKKGGSVTLKIQPPEMQ